MERVDKLLAQSGRWSRKEAKALVRAGRVQVDGRIVTAEAEKCSAACDLCVDGVSILTKRFVYYMLHKPPGYLSATEDAQGPVVLDLLPKTERRRGLFPVGRLDKDTRGLLLICNDGALAHHLLSPRHHVEKCYEFSVETPLDDSDILAFREGLQLRDGTLCRPAALLILDGGYRGEVRIVEGKYHQVKRMLAARGKPLYDLKRLSMGSLTLDETLPEGAARPLTEAEICLLKEKFPEDSAFSTN